MPSLQSHLLVQMFKYWRRRHPARGPARESWVGVRRLMADAAARTRVPPDIHVEPVVAGGVPAEWVHAPGARADRALLYLHGGGYVAGSPGSHRGLAAALSRAARVRVLSLDYRLAPEHPFPAAVHDAAAGYQWLLGEGFSPRGLAIAGDSAGGGLSAATLVYLRDQGAPLPAAGVLLSPWADLEATGASITARAADDLVLVGAGVGEFGRLYAGEGDVRHPLISPIHADLRGLPPLLIQVGTREVLFDDAVRLSERVRDAGGRVELEVWEGMLHVFQIFVTLLPEARQAVQKIAGFLRAELG